MALFADESSPLLRRPASTPLPKVFPYINEMIADLHLPGGPSHTAFYSGLAESAFAISSLFSIYHWARLSDVIGRRPVIFIGMLGMNLATLLFGLQRSLVGLLLVRCLGGFFSGNVAVIYSVLGELTDSTNQAIAFPIFSLAWPVGTMIGPLIGGTFSNPASTFPNSTLFHHDLFRTYPYFLPGCIASIVSLIGVILGFVLLEETLPSKCRELPSSRSIQELDQQPIPAPFTLKKLVSVPIIRAISLSGAGLSFTYTAFDVLFVLFCYSPIESGGLALSPTDIGFCLAISGFVACMIQLFVTPVLIARCDHIRAYNRCMSLWPFCFLTLPLLNIVARTGLSAINGHVETDTLRLTDADCRVQAMVWCGIIALLALSRLGSVAFGLSMILVKEMAPTPESLGATNGLVQFAMSFTRSICPAFASSLFALLASGKFPSGYLWVVVMAAENRSSSLVTHDSSTNSTIVRRGSGLLTISNHSSEDLYTDVIGVVWCGYPSTLHQAMNHNYFFHGFVGGKIANLSIFAYMAAILNSDMEWSLKEYYSHRCLAHSEMSICMMMSLGDLCASTHLKREQSTSGHTTPAN